MQFVIGGTRHKLDAETVANAARRIVPESIDGRHKYYVEIEGRYIPIKQLLSQVTGLHRRDFISLDANRVLKKLGFTIQQFDRPLGPAADLGALNAPGTHDTEGAIRFAVSLEPDEDGYIVASCPQLPGCHSQGRTRQEAIKNIQEAIRGYTASMKRHGEEIHVVDWELVEVAL